MRALIAGRLLESETLVHVSTEGLVHEVWLISGSTLTWRCALKRVYGTRSSSYLPHELSDTNNTPITCLWCITGK